MSQFPLDTESNLVEAVNYLLSGPTSSGQNFEGMSAVGRAIVANSFTDYFTGSLSLPYEDFRYDNQYPLWSTFDSPIIINNITIIDDDKLSMDVTIPDYSTVLTTNWTTEPFSAEQIITVSGVSPSIYNADYQLLSVTYGGSLTATIIVRPLVTTAWTTYTSGGEISWNYVDSNRPTDCNAVVTVTGPTDRVFVSSQSTTKFAYYVTEDIFPGDLTAALYTNINRYVAVAKTTLPDNTIGADYQYEINPSQFITLQQRHHAGYVWQLEKTLLSIPTLVADTISAGTFTELSFVTNIFNNIIDSPGIGQYWYMLEFYFSDGFGYLPIFPIYMQTTGLRSFTAQVIKR